MNIYISKETGAYEIHGVHSDTKPVGSVPANSVFWEQDLDEKYYYNAATKQWSKVGGGVTPSPETPVQVTVSIPAAAAQADSEATDVATLVTDFNALLAKLQAAGLMETPAGD